MFVGHFAIAFVLWRSFPQVPLPVSLVAVSFPDLLWSLLVPAGLEKVRVNPSSPLQKFLVFEKFPYSHSLILSNLFSLIVGLAIAGFLGNPLVVPIFVAGSVSHWLLDTVVHLKDLPVLGFNGDTKVGLGLWRRGRLAFLTEYVFYLVVVGLTLPYNLLLAPLITASVFHLVNANSFFGFTKGNTVKSSNTYAGLALFGFTAFTVVASLIP